MAERPASRARVAGSRLNSRVEAASNAIAPEFILALAGTLMVLVYAVGFVRPFGLLHYWRQPLLDLQKMSAFMPLGHWELLAGFAVQGILYYAGWRAALAARGRLAWWIVIAGGAAAGVVLLFLLPFDAADIAIWPLGLAALFPAGYELGLAELLGFVTLSKPLLVAPIVLWRVPFHDQVWRELRLGPAVLALPWIGALFAVAWAIRRGLARRVKPGSDR